MHPHLVAGCRDAHHNHCKGCNKLETRPYQPCRTVDSSVSENRQPDSFALGVKARRFVTEWVGVLQETQPYVKNVLALMPRFAQGPRASGKKSARP